MQARGEYVAPTVKNFTSKPDPLRPSNFRDAYENTQHAGTVVGTRDWKLFDTAVSHLNGGIRHTPTFEGMFPNNNLV